MVGEGYTQRPYDLSAFWCLRLQRIMVSFKRNLYTVYYTLLNTHLKLLLFNFLLLYRYSYRYLNYFEQLLYSGWSSGKERPSNITLCFQPWFRKQSPHGHSFVSRPQLVLLYRHGPVEVLTVVWPRSQLYKELGLMRIVFRTEWQPGFLNVLIAMWPRLQCGSFAL